MSASTDNNLKFNAEDSWEDMVLPYVLDELSEDEKSTFELTLERSELCRLRVYEMRRTVQQLRDVPRDRMSRDLSVGVLGEIAKLEKGTANPTLWRSHPWSQVLKAAACVAFLAVGLMLAKPLLRPGGRDVVDNIVRQNAQKKEAVARGLDWLAGAQESTGAWDGSKWGGSARNDVGLTGLALLALVSCDEGADCSYEKEIDLAVRFLAHAQRGVGVIGSETRGPGYDHSIATCALLEVYARQPDAEIESVLDKALRHIAANRDSSGGWGYGSEGPTLTSVAASEWSALALTRASALGWTEYRAEARTGFDTKYSDVENVARLMKGQTDFHQSYLVAIRLASTSRDEVLSLLTELQSRIISTQEMEGPFAGSWGLSDRLSGAGGRVYTTSMATLTLNALSQPAGS
ncbi:MAG: hypothetical protein KJ626_01120 [Verrucomicrobia bacterium]|nr:hypothetical protein [Verrucomicrobiota bacterium]